MPAETSLRDFFLKIGFVITLALSFNPVDGFAEPVVISLPVVVHNEWVLQELIIPDHKAFCQQFFFRTPVPQNFDERKSFFPYFFRLIHYDRLVKVQLRYPSFFNRLPISINKIIPKRHSLPTGGEDFIA